MPREDSSCRIEDIYRTGRLGDRALIDDEMVWTYGALAAAVDCTAVWLERQSARPGDRVMIVNDNTAQAVIVYFAALRCHCWPVLVNARLSVHELAAISAHATPRITLFVTARSIHAARHAERAGATEASVPLLGRVAVAPINASATFESVTRDPARDVAALVYTTGSTGTPKGVMLTHRNLLFIARATAAIRHLDERDCFLGVLPISHIVGLTVVLLGTLLSGGAVRLVGRFNPSALHDMLAAGDISVILGAPALFGMMTDYARSHGVARLQTPRLRMIGTCGAPLDATTKRETEALFGQTLHNGYGTTECAPTIAQTRPEQPRTTCTVGPLLDGVQARLVDADGGLVGNGSIGTLHIKGPNVMRGYYRDDAATAAVLDAEGWFDTRDLARFEGADLTILGRARDLIIRSGHNVSPVEVEAALNAHPAIAQSAVIGVPVAGNEDIHAYIKLADGVELTADDLAAHVARWLAPHQRPQRYVRVAAFAMAPNGKILKTALRSDAAVPSGATLNGAD